MKQPPVVLLLLALLACASTACEEGDLVKNPAYCDDPSDGYNADEQTPFGLTAREVAERHAHAQVHLQWNGGSEAGSPLVDELSLSTTLNTWGILGIPPAGYLPEDRPDTSFCTGQPSDDGGLRLSLFAHFSDPDQAFTATGLQMIYLSGPDLEPDQAGFNMTWRLPLVVTTSDPALLARAAANDERVDPTVSPQSFLAFWVGVHGESELGEMRYPSLYLYIDSRHRERGEYFAQATMEIEWSSEPP